MKTFVRRIARVGGIVLATLAASGSTGCLGDPRSGDARTDAGAEVAPDGGEGEPHDVVVPDPGPDCGPVQCFDCACGCDDGRRLPYGGCFGACDPVPDTIRTCSADCVAMCQTVNPTPCSTEGIPGDCQDGQACVTVPCPHCGMQPQSFCVTAPCQPGGCYVDSHCADGGACYDADIPSGVMGFCQVPPEDPASCWSDSACPDVSRCVGRMACPPCVLCDGADHPGTCRLPEGQSPKVLLHLDESMVSPGETIPPTWFNFTSGDVFLAGCATFTIDGKDASSGQWVDRGPPYVCGVEGTAVRLPPGEGYRAMPFPAPMDGITGASSAYRLRGGYWTGCIVDRPISTAQCTGGPFEVLSIEYQVGLAP